MIADMVEAIIGELSKGLAKIERDEEEGVVDIYDLEKYMDQRHPEVCCGGVSRCLVVTSPLLGV